MASETENEKQLKAFFTSEYHNLKAYVHSKIENDADRDAEDIIQDVALKIFSRKNVLPINNVAGFVYYSIKNKIIDSLRKDRKTKNMDEAFEEQLADFAENFYDNTEQDSSDKLVTELKKAIFKLKPQYREIILAIDVEGYSYAEISQETGIPIGTLLSRRHRAISLLYQQLKNKK
ncbi:RNA polymerase subunit sigma-24 [Polaribacter pacificus]|uniref:RNA polymerase subunit sigma-24 n=1 Tax=Polaribacter pacificus TaxID=1775173 RepID=A0A917I1A0_9FLAO|nr:RNA polymerase sigma factor [Polaribacter pacificus]GGH01037.1 RNA polymerase subunit sigma-24 [Polaribacter pacificus]